MKAGLTPDEQTDAIIELMTTGQWRGRASAKELAEKWGRHPRIVHYAAERASAFVSRTGGPLEAYVLDHLAQLEQVQAVAMGLPKPDVKAAIMAIRTRMEIRGVLTKQKQQPKEQPAATAEDYEQMTPEQRVEAHKQAIAEEEQKMAGRH